MGKIERTEFKYDLEAVNTQWIKAKKSLTPEAWYQKSQTCLQFSPQCVNRWTEGCGSIKRAGGRTEQDFYRLNPIYENTIFEQIINDLGAVRTRVIAKSKNTCYSIHLDRTPRYHLAMDTHQHALFVFCESTTVWHPIHIPADGYIYMVDTRFPHTFVNAGPTRTHLVMCR